MDETSPLIRDSRNGPTETIAPDTANPLPSEGSESVLQDHDDPQHWRKAYKWLITLLLAFTAFTVTFTCIGVVPIASAIVKDLDGHNGQHHGSSSASVLLVTIWELGEAAGPLLIAPLSELYGRYPVYNIANGMFIFCVALSVMSQSTGFMIAARFLNGCAVASNVLNPAIIGDIFPTKQRGSAMSLVMLTPLLGGAIGPAIAGAIAQDLGWRKVLLMALCLAGVVEAVFLCLFRETYKPVILRKRAARLALGADIEVDPKATESNDTSTIGKSPIVLSIVRPGKVFTSSFVLQIFSLYGAVVFSFFYVMSTTLPDILQQRYGFSPAHTGLSFLTFSVGSILGIIICNLLVDRIYIRLQDPSAPPQPEKRLPLVILGAIVLPIIVAAYGWIAQIALPVQILLVVVALMGAGLTLATMPMISYVVDAFGDYSASAMTAILITRCLMGTFLPLAAAPLVQRLGYGFGITVLAGLSLLLAPVPVFVFVYGERWRQVCDFTRN